MVLFSGSRWSRKQQLAAAAALNSGDGGDMDLKHRMQHRRRTPRLDRRNAHRHIDYEAGGTPSPDMESPSDASWELRTQSLDVLPSLATKTSFRIDGELEGEVYFLCRNLGLSGPEDFAIPTAAWEASKSRSPSGSFPRSRLFDGDDYDGPADVAAFGESSPPLGIADAAPTNLGQNGANGDHRTAQIERSMSRVGVRDQVEIPQSPTRINVSNGASDSGGIRGPRPPPLVSPISRPIVDDTRKTRETMLTVAPKVDDVAESVPVSGFESTSSSDSDDGKEMNGVIDLGAREEVSVEALIEGLRGITGEELTGTSTSIDGDSSSATPQRMYVSPNISSRRNIFGWIKGKELGRGSFGTVYEAISSDGFFFAVKEVSLLDQGANAQQCIQQLEQEIALLSNFEHENIVQYLGTEKGEGKLYIFLELVTQGSLSSLYQKYQLRDSQVSAYTRQILNGLKYLHERSVVHRDIKCGNILVHASGFVKLADFGLAKETSKLNALKSCKGSVYWMAPEVVKPQKTYGPAADIWSLGCTVLEMLTQKLPYPNLEWTQALFKIGRGVKPEIPDSLSRDACDFISQCVQVNPDDRPTASMLLDHPYVSRQLSSSGGSSSDSSSRGKRA